MITTWLQRAYTNSHFDHVAICLKYQDRNRADIIVLEAVGDLGVRIVPWYEMRLSLGSYYEKVCIRKLKTTLSSA